MSKFIKTIPGKVIIFFICVISVMSLIFCGGGAVVFLNENGYFYTHTEEEISERLFKIYIENKARNCAWNAVMGYDITDDSGIRFFIEDNDKNIVYDSDKSDNNGDFEYSYTFGMMKSNDGSVYDMLWDVSYDDFMSCIEDYYTGEYYTVKVSEKEGTVSEFTFERQLLHISYRLRYTVYLFALISFVLFISSFIALMCASGRKSGSDEICTGILDKIPYDIILALGVLTDILIVVCCFDAMFESVLAFFICVLLLTFAVCVFVGVSMVTAVRIKNKTIFYNTVTYRILSFVIRIVKWTLRGIAGIFRFIVSIIVKIPIFWKFVLGFGIYMIIKLIVFFNTVNEPFSLFLLMLFEHFILFLAAVYFLSCLKKLQKGGRSLASGDLSYVTDTKGMVMDLKEHGENLNSIALGMTKAVNERTKSERMKTELITNVSHDIKTPLTSIINYAGLIGNEECENEKIKEYSGVLVRQSERLKRLIEDLVEASKASTGNLDVSLAPCDASIFITQASGEYEEKLKNAGLTLITRVPENEVRIMADGRRMWRVFDNLMNNICKYAQTDTRVYLSLVETENNAVITFKNTSREPLDMTEDELMERFTRGDSSRNTEGNGLGLSIARSMAELQKGKLNLFIDGDLFKAVLTFPKI